MSTRIFNICTEKINKTAETFRSYLQEGPMAKKPADAPVMKKCDEKRIGVSLRKHAVKAAMRSLVKSLIWMKCYSI